MSFLVTRPLMPDPWICEISTLCSCAILRTRGDDRCRRNSSRDMSALGCVSTRAVEAAAWVAAAAGAAWLDAAAAAAVCLPLALDGFSAFSGFAVDRDAD